jgi:hypothetical protein
MVRCWRPERHEHEDRTPSVSIWPKKNLVRCFGCNETFSTIDLVMSVLGLATYRALLWLDERFHLPHVPVPKGKHLSRPAPAPFRVGVNGRLEPLVCSGFYAQLTNPEIRLLDTLNAFEGGEPVRLSYLTLKRYSGIKQNRTLIRALKDLANLHALEIIRGRGGRGLSEPSSYRLTLEDSRFLATIWKCQQRVQSEIDLQREMRDKRRALLSLSPRGRVKLLQESERMARRYYRYKPVVQ